MTIPAALVIIVEDRAYMTVREWKRPDNSEHKAIDTFDSYFGIEGAKKAFEEAVDACVSHPLEKLIGAIVVKQSDNTDDTVNELPDEPSVCAFRVERGKPYFIARWMKHHGHVLHGENLLTNFSVFALMEASDDLMGHFQSALDLNRGKPGQKIVPSQFLKAGLVPVYSSFTITKPVFDIASGGYADSGGDGYE